MGITEVKTVTDRIHKYHLPYREFWSIIKDSEQIGQHLYWSRTFNSPGHLEIKLNDKLMLNYIKTLCEGEVETVTLIENDIIEIVTRETAGGWN